MTGLALVSGAVAGSAAGAAMHRWPTGATLLEPRRSGCVACGVHLRARDLVPILSWLVLRGRCAACGSRIDPRIPILEAASAFIFVAVLHTHGASVASAVLAVGAVAALLGAFIDVEHLIVPDRLTLPLGVLGVLFLPAIAGPDRVASVAMWALGVPLGLALVARAADAMGRARPVGGGDIKLLVGVLALAGSAPYGPPAVLLGAVLVGGSVATLGLLTGVIDRRSRLPFAPALVIPLLIVLVAPERAADILALLGGPSWSA